MIRLSLLLLLSSCFNSSLPNYSRDEMLGFARAGDPKMIINIGAIDKALVDCNDYKIPCRTGYSVVVKGLTLKALHYDTQEVAIQSSKRLKTYRSRNWVFEDVVGEPILERFVVKYLKASKDF